MLSNEYRRWFIIILTLEYIIISQERFSELLKFFRVINKNNDEKYFHPHPFNQATAEKIANYSGKDLYFLQIFNKDVSGYGMLRGWDEGFINPSLGIIIHPLFRGKGLGLNFMNFLHEQSRIKKASKVRLKVYSGNSAAVKLYKNMGYRFSRYDNNQLIGHFNL